MTISHIFHISDIHIRNGDIQLSRYNEYNTVFDNLFKSIHDNIATLQLSHNNILIVLSGDIFHNKNVIGSYGLDLFKKLIKGLTNIAKTIVFHGNHDRFQHDAQQPSLVSCTMEIDNLIILRNSQSFVIDDVGFTYVSIDDTLSSLQSVGRMADLPPFPEITENTKYKIALFHGTFAKVKLYNGTETDDTFNPYPFEWINKTQEIDFALLGDIHLRQHDEIGNTMWGYAGSLVQQNYGEDIISHGYLIWDLHNNNAIDVDVYNPIGYVNIKSVDNTIMLRIRGTYIPLENYIIDNTALFPKHLIVKLYSDIDINSLLSILNKYDITCDIVNKSIVADNTECVNTSAIQPADDLDFKVSKQSLLNYFQNHLNHDQLNILKNILHSYEHLLFDLSKYPEDLHDDCRKKNKEISQLISSCIKADDVQVYKPNFVIKYLEWKNLYCYENVNWIDFDKASFSTFLISGLNGTGKSAIYDILTMAIWGDITTSKQNTLSAGIIHFNHKSAYTLIEIEMAGIRYRIYRNFTVNTGRDRINKAHSAISKYSDGLTGSLTVLKKEKACNEEVIKLFGTLEEFLSTSMVTQNMDFDILKMDYKTCLSVIDKSADIDFIYHLYNLLKGCSNKYKDFKKIIEAKKDVYHKLLQTSNASLDILDYKQKVIELTEQLSSLQNECHSITVNINDPNNKKILDTDYNKLIADLGDIHIKTQDEYTEALNEYNELLVQLKGYTDKQIKEFKNMNIDDPNTVPCKPIKPCEYSFIDAERKALSSFKNPPKKPKCIDIDECKANASILSTKIKHMLDNKPPNVSKPPHDTKYGLKKVAELFPASPNPVNTLLQFCNSNNRLVSKNTVHSTINHNEYLDMIEHAEQLNKITDGLKTEIVRLDAILKDCHKNMLNVSHKSPPNTPIAFHDISAIQSEMQKFNIDVIKETILHHQAILDQYYSNLDNITNLENMLASYNNELTVLTTNDQYKYNKRCKICMQRSWVARIQELHIIINSLKEQVADCYTKLYDEADHDYLLSFITLEDNTKMHDLYMLYHNWYEYYSYKETVDRINIIMADKERINAELKEADATLLHIQTSTTAFNASCFSLFDLYNHIMSFNAFSEWKNAYDALIDEKNNIDCDIDCIQKYLNYQNDILPRFKRLNDIEKEYDAWKSQDMHYKSFIARKLDLLKGNIDAYSKFQEYSNLLSLQPLILRKADLLNNIAIINNSIIEYNNVITSFNATQLYIHNSSLLSDAISYIDNVIDLNDVILNTFKGFRKDLYDNIILRKIVDRANKFILDICHENSKPFQLDFIISDVKDIVHINWLIRNNPDDMDVHSHIISVHQASGFQRFAISLALRLTLYLSKTSSRCSQLFIDEGFTACDHLNLQIVPYFLKHLLKTFHTIILVSHIDLIKDVCDLHANIIYDCTKGGTKDPIGYNCTSSKLCFGSKIISSKETV